MRISIITESKDWICMRAAQELQNRISGCQIDGDIHKADIVYLMPYTKIGKIPAKIPGKLVSLMTHYEEESSAKSKAWHLAEDRSEALIFMCRQPHWRHRLFSMRNTRAFHWASDLVRERKVFGFCGHARPRKRPEYAKGLIERGFRVASNGKGWPHASINTDDHTRAGRESFYDQIDYLIVSSSLEGGPVPVLDALACGVPVIAPDVGWCWEYPVIRYNGTFEHLVDICKKLDFVRTWADYANDHRVFFEGLIK